MELTAAAVVLRRGNTDDTTHDSAVYCWKHFLLIIKQMNLPPTKVGTLATSFCTACAMLKRLSMLTAPPVPASRLNVTSSSW